MKKWTDGYVDANGIKIHYYRTGGDKPQVVLNHGALDDGLCWTRVAKELEQDYDVIMFDARGHGFSDKGNDDYWPATRAKDLGEAIQALGLDRPIVGGHSLGGEVTMNLAALYPEIPRAIFMEDPPIAMPGEPMFGGDMADMGENVVKMMVGVMSLIKILPVFLGKIIARKMMPVSPDDEIIPWIHSKKRVDKDFFTAMLESGENPFSLFDAAEKIKAPALLIMGDRDAGSVVSEEVAEKLTGLIPDLQIAHLRGANHDIRRAKFDEYMVAVRGFLAEHSN